MVRVGVCLSGCGFLDGAEIHESVITLLALDRAGAEAVCFAPDVEQMHVVDHRSGEVVEGETRNVLAEAARIARGAILPAAEVGAGDFDALILPGGYGAAKNLSDFAVNGPACAVQPDVARVVRETAEAGKPLGVICIAPAVCAAVFQEFAPKVELTIGSDAGTAEALEKMGAKHVVCPAGEIHIDEGRNVVSTPAYMLDSRLSEVAAGIEKLVAKVVERCGAGMTPAG